ncbi:MULTISPECIES: hypothetical protein [Streptomyces]|uniref:Uncharacterized protein n=1 Tax=Streptomyces ramulosus TaxID=47762 RepID=A0ABW1FK38_9ACTN
MTSLQAILKSTLGAKPRPSANKPHRGRGWYELSKIRRIAAATLSIPAPEDTKQEAQSAIQSQASETIESLGGLTSPFVPHTEYSELEAVCGDLDLIHTALSAVIASEEQAPLMGGIFLNSARRSVARLSNGLMGHKIGKGDSLRLVNLIGHNLVEAERDFNRQQGVIENEEFNRRIEELTDLVIGISVRVEGLRPRIAHLFDDATDRATLTSSPS